MTGPGLLLCCTVWSTTADPLPMVEEVNWPQLRRQAETMSPAPGGPGSPLSAEGGQALRKLLSEKEPRNPDAAAAEVQKLLDSLCLVGVTINPESRVKVVRGPAAAEASPGARPSAAGEGPQRGRGDPCPGGVGSTDPRQERGRGGARARRRGCGPDPAERSEAGVCAAAVAA